MTHLDRELIRGTVHHAWRTGWANRIVLLRPGSKVPAFKGQLDEPLTLSQLDWHLSRFAFNYGLILNREPRVTVIDKDAVSMPAHRLLQTCKVHRARCEIATPRGVHFYRLTGHVKEVRTRIGFLGLKLDVKQTGYIVGPGSWNEDAGFRYAIRPGSRFCAPEELDPLTDSFVELLNRDVSRNATLAPIPVDAEPRLLKYVECIDKAEETNGGSRACYVACLKILSLTGGDVGRAWPLLLHYNRTRCSPPFDEEATDGPDSLSRKLSEALKVWKPRGA